jgi:hypothetical protein
VKLSCLTLYKYLVLHYLQEWTTFELGVVVIGTHEPSCIQMEIYVEIFVDFDGF